MPLTGWLRPSGLKLRFNTGLIEYEISVETGYRQTGTTCNSRLKAKCADRACALRAYRSPPNPFPDIIQYTREYNRILHLIR